MPAADDVGVCRVVSRAADRAGVAGDLVVAGPPAHLVRARAAVQRVGAFTADDDVLLGAAGDEVLVGRPGRRSARDTEVVELGVAGHARRGDRHGLRADDRRVTRGRTLGQDVDGALTRGEERADRRAGQRRSRAADDDVGAVAAVHRVDPGAADHHVATVEPDADLICDHVRRGAAWPHEQGADVSSSSPDEAVVAGLAVHPVGARTALDTVVARTAPQVVAAGAAGHRVVARPAGGLVVAQPGVDGVVAVTAVDAAVVAVAGGEDVAPGAAGEGGDAGRERRAAQGQAAGVVVDVLLTAEEGEGVVSRPAVRPERRWGGGEVGLRALGRGADAGLVDRDLELRGAQLLHLDRLHASEAAHLVGRAPTALVELAHLVVVRDVCRAGEAATAATPDW